MLTRYRRTNMADELNFQLPESGFGSYAYGVIPDDQAVLAGAFAASMGQIRNIQSVDLQRFAQVVYSIETNFGLPLTNGTDVPADQFLIDAALTKTALGSGLYGTYTMSDFIGTMSGLPHPVESIYNGIKELETTKLRNIYQELYLAVQWEGATATIQYTTGSEVDYVDPGPPPTTYYKWYWQITGITLTDNGGGYGRGGAPAPNITITGGSGATATCTIGTDPSSVGSNGSGLYGRLTSVTLTYAGTKVYYATGQASSSPGPVPSPPLAQIQCPPTATLAVDSSGNKATGGSNTAFGTAGWPGMNSVVQAYITQGNDEIYAIQTNAANFDKANVLNTNWNITGTSLKIEQRSRYIAIPPVPVPYDKWLNLYPTALYVFADSVPAFAEETLPHMAAQTLENIVDFCSVAGQSLVGKMRESRNESRLQEVGINLDNNIPAEINPVQEQLLMTNGTVPGAADGVPSPTGEQYTLPPWPSNKECAGPEVAPQPKTYFDPNLPGLRTVVNTVPGSVLPILKVTSLGPNDNGTGPPVDGVPIPVVVVNNEVPVGPGEPLGLGIGLLILENIGDGTSSLGTSVIPEISGPGAATIPGTGGTGTGVVPNAFGPGGEILIAGVPDLGTTPVSLGAAPGTGTGGSGSPFAAGLPVPALISVPGAGGLAQGGLPGGGNSVNLFPPGIKAVLPPTLDAAYSSSTLLPGSYGIAEAIDKVIECNCDCWVN